MGHKGNITGRIEVVNLGLRAINEAALRKRQAARGNFNNQKRDTTFWWIRCLPLEG